MSGMQKLKLKENGYASKLTGADVTAVPSSRITKETKFTKTDKKLFGAGHAEIKVKGKFSADLKLAAGKSTEQEIYVLKGLRKPLLERPANQSLQMFQRINALNVMPPRTSNVFKKSFPELFTGLGRVSSEYRIAGYSRRKMPDHTHLLSYGGLHCLYRRG